MKDFFRHPQVLSIAVLVAVVSILLAPYINGINSIVLGLFIGIILGNIVKFSDISSSNINYLTTKTLELAIVFMAFGISYGQLFSQGISSLTIIVLMIVLVLLVGVWLGKVLKTGKSPSWLISFGTAICGSSAIAALSPSFTDDKEEIGISIAVINLLGTVGMISLPFLLPLFDLTEPETGFFIGTSLHSLGNVAGAGYAMDQAIGDYSITIKMIRIAMLSPALVAINLINHKKENTSKSLRLPWYLIAFVAISFLVSFVKLQQNTLELFANTSEFLLTLAMVAIGMKISFAKLITSGKKGLLHGSLLFLIQMFVIVVLMKLFF